jgi:hypothetical protein
MEEDPLRPLDVVEMRTLSRAMPPMAGHVGTPTKPSAALRNLS